MKFNEKYKYASIDSKNLLQIIKENHQRFKIKVIAFQEIQF